MTVINIDLQKHLNNIIDNSSFKKNGFMDVASSKKTDIDKIATKTLKNDDFSLKNEFNKVLNNQIEKNSPSTIKNFCGQ